MLASGAVLYLPSPVSSKIHSNTQTLRHSDTQTLRHSDNQTFRHSDTQTLRRSDIETLRHSDTQTLRHSDTREDTQQTHSAHHFEFMRQSGFGWHTWLKMVTESRVRKRPKK
jgi:hypothetical protein